ncbi:MAG: DNA internalization-related competence protein ComEC/Rec2, partial [Thermoclostridium sp.]|nr:DNA internalization-related competence protein ComEC/Rec2 [Thermoclostridium sp.]
MMKRPVLHAAIAFGAGILAAWYIRQVFFFMIIFLLAMLLFGYGQWKKLRWRHLLLLWALCFFCGYINYAYQYTVLRKPVELYQGCEITVSGYVSSACTLTEGKAAFSFFAEKIQLQGKSEDFSRNVRIDAYRVSDAHDFSPGTRLNISGVLEKPSGSRNPGGFNYESMLFAQKTPARMAVKTEAIRWSGENKNLPLLRFGLGIRQVILDRLESNLSDEKAALMAAMLTGYRENLTNSMENAFSIAGLTHIMAVSGSNLAFLLFPLLWLLKMLGLNRKAAAVATVPFLFFFVLVTGMEASVLRACVMACVLMAGKALDRKADLLNSLGIASLLLLAVNPFMLFDTGFILSFGATAGLALLYARIRGVIPEWVPKFIRETVSATIAAQAGILPLLILFFSRISLISLLSNLLVVPLTGITTVMGMVCVVLGSFHPIPAQFIGYMLQSLLHVILFITDFCASIPWAQVHMQHWRLPAIFAWYAVLIPTGVYGLPFFIRHKTKLAAAAFLAGACILLSGLMPGRLKVTFIDVGQGDSALIQTASGRNYLMDGGGTFQETETGYIGKRILLPLFMHEGVTSLEQVFISHAHTDHMAGVLTLLQSFPVKSVGLPAYSGADQDFEAVIKICNEKGIEVKHYRCEDEVSLDAKTTIRFLNPNSETPTLSDNLNNTSLCALLSYGQLQIFFTGDLETSAEKTFFANNPRVDCDILKVPHHGGKNASSESFIQYTMPETAVISVGRNSFGHPSEAVLKRLDAHGIKVYVTLENGAVIVDSDGKKYHIR